MATVNGKRPRKAIGFYQQFAKYGKQVNSEDAADKEDIQFIEVYFTYNHTYLDT